MCKIRVYTLWFTFNHSQLCNFLRPGYNKKHHFLDFSICLQLVRKSNPVSSQCCDHNNRFFCLCLSKSGKNRTPDFNDLTVDSFKCCSCPIMTASPECVEKYAGGVLNFVKHLSALLIICCHLSCCCKCCFFKSWIINECRDFNFWQSHLFRMNIVSKKY